MRGNRRLVEGRTRGTKIIGQPHGDFAFDAGLLKAIEPKRRPAVVAIGRHEPAIGRPRNPDQALHGRVRTTDLVAHQWAQARGRQGFVKPFLNRVPVVFAVQRRGVRTVHDPFGPQARLAKPLRRFVDFVGLHDAVQTLPNVGRRHHSGFAWPVLRGRVCLAGSGRPGRPRRSMFPRLAPPR
jgi:hypothetical protein